MGCTVLVVEIRTTRRLPVGTHGLPQPKCQKFEEILVRCEGKSPTASRALILPGATALADSSTFYANAKKEWSLEARSIDLIPELPKVAASWTHDTSDHIRAICPYGAVDAFREGLASNPIIDPRAKRYRCRKRCRLPPARWSALVAHQISGTRSPSTVRGPSGNLDNPTGRSILSRSRRPAA